MARFKQDHDKRHVRGQPQRNIQYRLQTGSHRATITVRHEKLQRPSRASQRRESVTAEFETSQKTKAAKLSGKQLARLIIVCL